MPRFDIQQCYMQGRLLDGDLLDDLTESSITEDAPALQERFQAEQYLFFRQVFCPEEVDAVREEVFGRLHEVGEIQAPPRDGLYTGRSRREQRPEGLGEFWRSVCLGTELRKRSHGAVAKELVGKVLGEPAIAHDYLFLRPAAPGRSTHLHYDRPFFARGSNRILTMWTAYGDIPVEEGPLLVVDGSSRFTDLVAHALAVDYDSADTPLVQIMDSPSELARSRGAKLKTANFRAGDAILFSTTLLHGSLDNRSSLGRVRLSSDVRWQPAADPVDPRYAGDNPPGTTGAGYAELNGAKPLTVEWHKR